MKNLSILTLLLLLVGCKSVSKIMKVSGYTEVNNCMARLSIFGDDGSIETIASDTVVDNKFSFQFTVDKAPRMGTLSFNGTATSIVVEPGVVNASIIYGEGNIIKGGHYNKLMFAIDDTDEMKQLQGAIKTLDKSYDFSKITAEERRTYMKTMRELQNNASKLSKTYLQSLYNHSDAYVRLFALDLNYDASERAMEMLDAIEKEVGMHPSITMLRNMRLQREKAVNAKLKYVVGGQIYTFTAKNIDGKEYNLEDIYRKNSYTLVEFWASWCAPCIAEAQKLKPLYEKYGKQGFEIFAYSIDEDRDKWVTKSNQEQLKWINTHSDKASRNTLQSELAITAIPRNYLVDKDGKIVAVNIRHEELASILEQMTTIK